MASSASARSRRPATLVAIVASSVLLGACASISTGHAQALAVKNVCARPPADTSCTVQNVQRAGSGYIVTIDRRPPSGNDRVHVSVSRGGSVLVVPDTTRRAP
jgi:hypothetical protein